MEANEMRLEDLAKQPVGLRDGLGQIIVNDPQYLNGLETGSRFFTSQQLTEIEAKYPDPGLTFVQIQEELAKIKVILKPATFKKYVGMKLVSGTSRIKKTERGSIGFYPATVIRQINLIKYLLDCKRDFLECYISALKATPSNALQIIQEDAEDAFDITENIGYFTADTAVASHLDDLLLHKVISQADKEAIMSKVEAFRDACGNVYSAQQALQGALENLVVPGSYNLEKLFEAVKAQTPDPD
jgi:hypothetical protein